MKNYILFSLLFLFSACETGTKYEENSTKTKEENSILALIDRPSSAEGLVKASFIDKEKEAVTPRTNRHQYDPDNPLNGEQIVLEESFVDSEEIVEERETIIERETAPINTPIASSEDVSFRGGNVADGLNVKSIRVGHHATYTRLVFDVDQWFDLERHGGSVKKVGKYSVTYQPERNRVIVTLEGYRGFSAKFPQFSKTNVIEKIYLNEYLDDSGFQFTIELKESVKIKAYDYKNPARLIIDVTPLV